MAIGEAGLLRVKQVHDADPLAINAIDFVEFSCPVSVEFIYEE